LCEGEDRKACTAGRDCCPDQIAASGAHRPDTAHSGKIRLGGGGRLPLQGEPMERDRPRRSIQNRGA
jgi:hypothetical protein